MEHDRIIGKTDKPMDWVNSLVIVEKKDGSLRLCLDPKDLNSVIRHGNFQVPSFEDVVSCLEGRNSYWQLPLSEESSYLRTFNTSLADTASYVCHLEFAMYLRCCRGEYIVFGDMQGVEVIADDRIIAEATEEEHDRLLRNVMPRAREQNV